MEYNPTGGGDPTSVGGRGSVGGAGGFSGNPMYAPGNIGFGSTPADLTAFFPSATYMQAAQLPFSDPMKFAQKYAPFINNQINTNFNQAQDLALKELNTELAGMEAFAPAASALKRNLTSVDNQFNQAQRTQQLQSTMPGVVSNLAQQTKDAATYASGHVPDAVADAALNLNARSTAADAASVGGFGASSSVAQKASDLMSADQRIKLSQYGEGLIGQNAQERSALELSPTEYSNAGQQVQVMPSISGSQLTSSNLSQINSLTAIPTSEALGQQVQQREFQTNLDQQANQFNAQTANDFALQKFGYETGYAGTVAGAAQMNTNTGLELYQQQQYMQTMMQYMNKGQNSQMIGSLFQGLGALLGSGGLGGSGGGGLGGILGSLFGGGGSSSLGGLGGLLGSGGSGFGSILAGGVPMFGIAEGGATELGSLDNLLSGSGDSGDWINTLFGGSAGGLGDPISSIGDAIGSLF